MKKRILFLFLSLLALTGTALAAQLTEQEAGNAEASVTAGGETAYYETFSEAWTAATDRNVNTSTADAVITLLRNVTDEGGNHDFYLNQGQTVTLNLPGVTLTLDSRAFFIGSGQTLVINGASANGGSRGKIIRLATGGEPGVVRLGSDSSAPLANLRISRCDLESHNGPAVFGGDGNVEISGSTITARAVVSDWNRTAAVSLGPNPGVETTLAITGSTLSGQSGLSIGTGLTVLVEDSAITETGDGSSDYGVMMDGGTLMVRADSRIESPVEGVHVTGVTEGISVFGGGSVNAEGGTVEAAGEYSAGLRVYGGGAAVLSGGTYIGAGSAVETERGVSVKDLLADGFAYYRADGSIVSDADLGPAPYVLADRQVTVKTGDPGGSRPQPPRLLRLSDRQFHGGPDRPRRPRRHSPRLRRAPGDLRRRRRASRLFRRAAARRRLRRNRFSDGSEARRQDFLPGPGDLRPPCEACRRRRSFRLLRPRLTARTPLCSIPSFSPRWNRSAVFQRGPL